MYTYYVLKGFLKASSPPKVSNEMKCTNKKMAWNTQDTNLGWYVPKANVDHTISGYETAVSTFDHPATSASNMTYSTYSPNYALIIHCTYTRKL